MKRALLRILLAVLPLAIVLVLAQVPWFVEEAYAGFLFEWTAALQDGLFGQFAFCAADVVLAAAAAALLAAIVLSLRRGARGLLCLARRVAMAVVVLIVLFELLFGFHYSRRPFASCFTLSRESEQTDRLALLPQVAAELVAATNRQYLELQGSADRGRPSDGPRDLAVLAVELDAALARAARALPARPRLASRGGRPKVALISPLMSRFGVTGFYFPFTGEAVLNGDVPAFTLPHTLAHEMAHQRGVAHEGEANFAGFLACLESKDPSARYAGLLFANRQLVALLSAADAKEAERLAAQRHPGVARDLAEIRRFWRAHDGPLAELGRGVNDRYLRLQRVQGGILAYGGSAELILALAAARGGLLLAR